MIVGIDHIQLAMPAGGEAAARMYYSQVLGLKEVPKPPDLALRGGCWFEGAIKVHLGVQSDFIAAKKAHPAFVVDDLEACAKHLLDHGFKADWNRNIPGVLRFFSFDPFGNRIEFMGEGK